MGSIDVITNKEIGELPPKSQEIIKQLNWTPEDLQANYHTALVLGQEFETHGNGTLVKEHNAFKRNLDMPGVISRKVEAGVIPSDKASSIYAALGIYYDRLSTRTENKSYQQMYSGISKQCMDKANLPTIPLKQA